MPFSFNPAVVPDYRPLGQGISQFGQDIGQALQAYGQNRQQQAFNDSVMDYLAGQSNEQGSLPGAVSADALQRYHNASPKERSGIILGALNNANMIRQQQQLANQGLLYGAHALMFAGLGRQPGGAGAGGPSAAPTISPFTDPYSGQSVPGLATVWSPTTKSFQVVQYPTAGPMIQRDPQGVPYITKGRERVMLTPEQIAALGMTQANVPGVTQQPTPTPTPGRGWFNLWGQPSPQPGGTPGAPAGTPGATPGLLRAGAGLPTDQERAIAAAADAIARGAPRDQVIATMQARGYDTSGL